ncbi:hypothetical protein ACSBLW_02300 [Thioclava sp. FR2]|uniref:hypothetical protein n=1 Tax=Thioclava sp. FR2 TaxID=3445780 RepID=UPI003EBB7632
MIISHSKKFLFIKPRKTAGSSVELALSPLLQRGDLATPIAPIEEKLRRAEDGVKVELIRYTSLLFPRRLRDHSTLEKAVACFGPSILGYFIISMTRNPWDRAVSQFFWTLRRSDIKHADFDDQKRAFIDYTQKWGRRSWIDPFYGRKRQRTAHATAQYCYQGKPSVDFFIRFEFLSQDMSTLGAKLGEPSLNVPENRLKSQHRNKLRPWWEFYDEPTKDMIASECSQEIQMFGYEFSDKPPVHGPYMVRA